MKWLRRPATAIRRGSTSSYDGKGVCVDDTRVLGDGECTSGVALAVSFCIMRRSDSSMPSQSAFTFFATEVPRVRLLRGQRPTKDIAQELLLRGRQTDLARVREEPNSATLCAACDFGFRPRHPHSLARHGHEHPTLTGRS